MQLVFKKKEFKVFERPNYESKEHKEYLVLNTKKEFEEGHTHISHYNQALYLVDCAIHKKIPKKVNKYFLVSLMRISKDTKFIEKIQRIINGEEPKGHYRNVPKGFLRKKQ